jgi:DNA-binding protein H-NS
MATLQELLDQRSALERQITDVRSQSRGQALSEIKTLMDSNGLTVANLSAHLASGKSRGSTPGQGVRKKVAAKYRNAETGDTWSGRGLKPRWLSQALASGKDIAEFAV